MIEPQHASSHRSKLDKRFENWVMKEFIEMNGPMGFSKFNRNFWINKSPIERKNELQFRRVSNQQQLPEIDDSRQSSQSKPVEQRPEQAPSFIYDGAYHEFAPESPGVAPKQTINMHIVDFSKL